MKVWRLMGLIAAIIAIVGCNSGKPTASDVTGTSTKPTSASNQAVTTVADPTPQPQGPGDPQYQQCGKETNRHGEGYDSKARDCLWQAVTDGKPVKFTTTSYTTEGDPITYSIQALAPSHGPGHRFTVLVDSRDKFGKQGQFNYACKGIQRVEQKYAAGQRYSFRLSECTGTGDGTEVHIP